jgi:tRNA U34 5-methylaminomethyl-2-thiouridine-forming methyltransferase MnmC
MNKYYQGDLGRYEVIMTEDESLTLISEFFDEACHSIDGAQAETIHNYILPCQIIEKAQTQNQLVILEIGLGLGTGYKTTIQSLTENTKARIHYIAVEIDEGLVQIASELNAHKNTAYPELTDLKAPLYQSSKGEHQLQILVGDAREKLLLWREQNPQLKVDAIYQDPFSPKKNPNLWTTEWFRLLYSLTHSGTLMSTYSASQSARKAMMLAGFKLESIKGFARKRQATLARTLGENDMECQRLLLNENLVPRS